MKTLILNHVRKMSTWKIETSECILVLHQLKWSLQQSIETYKMHGGRRLSICGTKTHDEIIQTRTEGGIHGACDEN
ncbi:hypothetical protein OPV22_007211 [Ensete ventricosum]|uniref:Uncharacterized protein n=1 Tax=Ensete ventricosum TaxID=4639 RepID=A0AAV8RUG5_ENSVE|nr:hypothetical protein OPV22_007211 [Ensete ventricosum]